MQSTKVCVLTPPISIFKAFDNVPCESLIITLLEIGMCVCRQLSNKDDIDVSVKNCW